MNAQIASGCEPLWAIFALEGLLKCVSAQMDLKVALLSEMFATLSVGAQVVAFPFVLSQMLLQLAFFGK